MRSRWNIVAGGLSGLLTLLAGARSLLADPDPREAIRREYSEVCHLDVALDRIVPSRGPGYNRSDYANWQLDDGDLRGLYQSVLSRYRGSTVVDRNGAPIQVGGHTVRIPANATIRISSGWRNPRRNQSVGSVAGCRSRHLFGRALDLVPEPTAGEVEGGSSTALNVQNHLFPTLWAAARERGFAIAEVGALPVPCGTFEDHVHVHRN